MPVYIFWFWRDIYIEKEKHLQLDILMSFNLCQWHEPSTWKRFFQVITSYIIHSLSLSLSLSEALTSKFKTTLGLYISRSHFDQLLTSLTSTLFFLSAFLALAYASHSPFYSSSIWIPLSFPNGQCWGNSDTDSLCCSLSGFVHSSTTPYV